MKYKKVLLIDDDEDSNFVNTWILKRNFAEDVITKQSAEEGLEYLKAQNNLRQELPQIIFLDIRMPGMDGFGFLEAFDQLSNYIKENCKIVILSSSFDKNDINRALKNPYVSDYFNKPLTEDSLSVL
jgi:CheY-like chemotaxis protein